MGARRIVFGMAGGALMFSAIGAASLHAAALPTATQAMLKKLDLASDVLSGLDAELAIPQARLDAARKESVVRVLGTWDPKQFGIMNAPFRERFPDIKGNPHVNASKLWVNWFLSKEGQLAQYAADQAPPVHKDLQIKAFLQFPDQITNRKIAFREPEQADAAEELYQIWTRYWTAGGGQKSDTPEE